MNIISKLTLFLKEDKSFVSERIKNVLTANNDISIFSYNDIIVAKLKADTKTSVATYISSNNERLTTVRITIHKIDSEKAEKSHVGLATAVLIGGQIAAMGANIIMASSLIPDKNTIAIMDNPISSAIYTTLTKMNVMTCHKCGAKSIKVEEKEEKSSLLDSLGGKLEAAADVAFLGGHMAGGLWNKSKRHTYRTRTYKCCACGEILKSETTQMD